MVASAVDKVKNVCVAGHGTTGKTTLVESLLFNMGALTRQGTVENKNTVSDFSDEEKEKGISISTSVATCEYEKNLVTFIDTPGYFDFSGEMLTTLPFAESAVLTIRGTSGLDIGLENAFNLARNCKRSVAFFITEIDKENADIDKILNSLETDFGVSIAPLSLPVAVGAGANAIIDVLNGKVVKYKDGKRVSEEAATGDVLTKIGEIKVKLMEAIAENDETLMEKYFAEGELTPDEIKSGLAKAFADGNVFPLFCGAPTMGVGVDILLRAIIDFFPTPDQKGKFVVDGNEIPLSKELPVKACIFKSVIIPQFGDVYVMKVLQGELKEGMDIYNATSQSSEKIGQLIHLFGKDRSTATVARAGEIVATVKLKSSKTGDQLVKDKGAEPFNFPLVKWPEVIVRASFLGEGESKDVDKIATGLKKLAVEDSTFRFASDHELKQLLVDGMGELHLETLALKLKNQYKIGLKIEEPRIPYRETIRGNADIRYRHKKQSGGAGQFGEVAIRLEPADQEYCFENRIVGGVISGRFIPAVEKGIKEVMTEGILIGCKFINCKVTLYDGKEHAVDSNEMAFKIAAVHAFKEAVLHAKPIILEPIYDVKVTVPDEYAGAVMGDISSRRGRPQGMDTQGRYQIVKAQVPLKELHGYSTQLRSMTTGRGTYTISFSHYDPVPPEVQVRLIDSLGKESIKEELEAIKNDKKKKQA